MSLEIMRADSSPSFLESRSSFADFRWPESAGDFRHCDELDDITLIDNSSQTASPKAKSFGVVIGTSIGVRIKTDDAEMLFFVSNSTFPNPLRYTLFSTALDAGHVATGMRKFGHDSICARVEELLNGAYVHVSKGDSEGAFQMVCDAIESDFSNDSVAFASELLRQISPDKAGKFLAVGTLRATFRARGSLSTWWQCVAETVDYLAKQKVDINRVMRGLLSRDDQAVRSK
jgi:hypothetical protein